jgi:uncharacterized RDD family membrane protein YckC
MAPNPPALDNAVEIITPENIAFRYQVAGPFRRLPAYLIDLMIRGVAVMILAVVAVFISGLLGLASAGFGDALLLVGWFLLAWFYGGLFETFWNGQTPGKRVMQIRVLSIDGQPINGLQAVLRNVLRAIDMQPAVFYLVGLVATMMNDRFQRLGDLACGTMVVVEEDRWYRGITQITEPEAARLAGLIPAQFVATRTQARALAAYVQRRVYFSWPRRIEIARHLGEPLRDRFGLPPNTDLDLLLCALYYRTFITDRGGNEAARPGTPSRQEGGSPFAAAPKPGAA